MLQFLFIWGFLFFVLGFHFYFSLFYLLCSITGLEQKFSSEFTAKVKLANLLTEREENILLLTP